MYCCTTSSTTVSSNHMSTPTSRLDGNISDMTPMRPQCIQHACIWTQAFGASRTIGADRRSSRGAEVSNCHRNRIMGLAGLHSAVNGAQFPRENPLGLIPWWHVERCRRVGVWWVSRWRRIDVGSLRFSVSDFYFLELARLLFLALPAPIACRIGMERVRVWFCKRVRGLS